MVRLRLLEWPQARATMVVVVFLCAIFLWSQYGATAAERVSFYQRYGLNRETVQATHGLTLLSHGLLHASWGHWLSNGLMILFLGARIESWWGARRFLTIFFGGILAGGAMHGLGSADSEGLLIGSSGGVMSLLLALTTSAPDSRWVPLPLKAKNVGYGVLIASMILMIFHPQRSLWSMGEVGLGLQSVMGAFVFQIGHACHAGGALFGLIYVHALLQKISRRAR